MENTKLTKKDYYGMIREILESANVENKDELVAFVDKQVEAIDTKAMKAKEKAAEKRADGDALRVQVEELLTDEYQTADDIVAKIEDVEITKAKVVARLTQLVKTEVAEKAQAKTEDGKKVMVYKKK